MTEINEIKEALIAIETDRLMELVRSGIDEGLPAKAILNDGLIAAMDVIGDKMESGDMFIPEVLKCARAMGTALGVLKPHLSVDGSDTAGKVVIGTVKGDLHDIGKNLVAMMLESGGFEVINIGIDVAPEKFVESIQEHKPKIIAISALLTTTMPMMKGTIETIDRNGGRSGAKIIVGGAPVTKTFAEEIGADGYAADAGAAVKLSKRLVNNN